MSVTKVVSQPNTNGLSLPPCLAPSHSDLDMITKAVSNEILNRQSPVETDEDYDHVSPTDYSDYIPPESALQKVINAIFNSVSFIFPMKKPVIVVNEPRPATPEVVPQGQNGVVDPFFQKNVSSSFLKNGIWDLKALKKQVENDIIRKNFYRINGTTISSFSQLCKKLGIHETPFKFSKVKKEFCEPAHNDAYFFMSMLQQGATVDLFVHPRPHLIGDSTELYLIGFSPDPHLRESAIEIIEKAAENAPSALELYQSASKKYPEFQRYIASAISLKALDEKFLPNWESFKDPLPLFPTQYIGTYDSETTHKLTIHQYLQLAKITDRIRETRLVHLTIQAQLDKPAIITWELV